jgi:hypothetical protein
VAAVRFNSLDTNSKTNFNKTIKEIAFCSLFNLNHPKLPTLYSPKYILNPIKWLFYDYFRYNNITYCPLIFPHGNQQSTELCHWLLFRPQRTTSYQPVWQVEMPKTFTLWLFVKKSFINSKTCLTFVLTKVFIYDNFIPYFTKSFMIKHSEV